MSAPPSPLSESQCIRSRNALTRVLLDHGVSVFQELYDLRMRGWSDDSLKLDDHFEKQRNVADNADDDLNYTWFINMKKVLAEVDSGTKCIPGYGDCRFLDLGCCPGGFTSYILNKNSEASGVGVSLPVEHGGHSYALEGRLRERFTLYFADLLSIYLGPSSDGSPATSLQHPPFSSARPFDLVLLDGHYLRTYKAAHSATPWDRDRLLISQLLIALQAVQLGGTLVIKMSHPEVTTNAKLLYMLDTLCAGLRLWKPTSMHSTRGTFYAVASGVGDGEYGEQLDLCIDGLRGVWQELYAGGEEGRGRFLIDEDLDFIATNEVLVDEYLARLIKLSYPVWARQRNSLHGWFVRKASRLAASSWE